MIISISGKAQHGKDSAAEGLINRHKFIRIGLADKLKDMCSSLFNIKREDMDNPDLKEKLFDTPKIFNNTVINNLISMLEGEDVITADSNIAAIFIEQSGTELKSIRHILQFVGTDVCRTYIADDIWLQLIFNKISNTDKNIVVPDARFPNERKFLKDIGAAIILIKRPELVSIDSHASENLLGNELDYDVVITNNSSVTNLQSSISLWYTIKRDSIQ